MDLCFAYHPKVKCWEPLRLSTSVYHSPAFFRQEPGGSNNPTILLWNDEMCCDPRQRFSGCSGSSAPSGICGCCFFIFAWYIFYRATECVRKSLVRINFVCKVNRVIVVFFSLQHLDRRDSRYSRLTASDVAVLNWNDHDYASPYTS
jgi:hypothetical protein